MGNTAAAYDRLPHGTHSCWLGLRAEKETVMTFRARSFCSARITEATAFLSVEKRYATIRAHSRQHHALFLCYETVFMYATYGHFEFVLERNHTQLITLLLLCNSRDDHATHLRSRERDDFATTVCLMSYLLLQEFGEGQREQMLYQVITLALSFPHLHVSKEFEQHHTPPRHFLCV